MYITARSKIYTIILLLNALGVNSVCNSYYHSEDGKFWYFAYGSNLLSRRIHIEVRTATFFSAARLDDYRLDFNMFKSRWNGAVATIVASTGDTTWGALWLINNEDMKRLDKQEGAGYFARNVTVVTPRGERVLARTYQETHFPLGKKPCGDLPPERRPSNTYLEVIALGAIESRLPPEYIGFVFSFPTNGKMASKEIRNQLGYPF